MKEVKVSVIVPVYNGEAYIRQCVESILDQSLREVQVICVDDGSTDGTVQVLEELCKKDDRLQILKQKNQYAGAARNFGMSVAEGEYLIFLDADDFFHSQMLETMYQKCKEDKAQICVCDGQIYDENTKEYLNVDYFLKRNDLPGVRPFSRKDMPEKIFNFTTSAPWNKMFERAFVEEKQLKFQDIRRANDLYFCNMALALAERITTTEERLVNYRRGHGTSLQAMKHNEPLDFYYAMLKLQEGLEKAKIFSSIEKSFANFCLGGCLYNLNTAKSGKGYSAIYRILKEEGFEKLHITGHSAGYFYMKNYYEQMQAILKEQPEVVVYEQMQEMEREIWHLKRGMAENLDFFKEISLEGTPKVSVIIPVYNVQEYLEECVESVRSQTLKNIEIICVNDGSTDESPRILRELEKQDSRIKIVDKPNGGLSSARNLGMKEASGEYILFLDSDDYLDLTALKTLYLYAKYYELDEMFYNASVFFDTKEVEEENSNYSGYYRRNGFYPETLTGRELFVQLMQNHDFKPSACLQILRREFLEEHQIRFYEGILHEDNLFTMQCISLAKRTRLLDRDFYKRRVRGGSIMTEAKGFRNTYGKFVTVMEMHRFIEEHHLQMYSGFYAALMKQLSVLCDSAATDLGEIKEEAVLDYVGTLKPEERDFYLLLVFHLREMRRRVADRAHKEVHDELRDLYTQRKIAQEQISRQKEKLGDQKKELEHQEKLIKTQKEELKKLKKQCAAQKWTIEDQKRLMGLTGFLRQIWRKLKKIAVK